MLEHIQYESTKENALIQEHTMKKCIDAHSSLKVALIYIYMCICSGSLHNCVSKNTD